MGRVLRSDGSITVSISLIVPHDNDDVHDSTVEATRTLIVTVTQSDYQSCVLGTSSVTARVLRNAGPLSSVFPLTLRNSIFTCEDAGRAPQRRRRGCPSSPPKTSMTPLHQVERARNARDELLLREQTTRVVGFELLSCDYLAACDGSAFRFQKGRRSRRTRLRSYSSRDPVTTCRAAGT